MGELPPWRYHHHMRQITRCQADGDDYCDWPGCPQLRDDEPRKSGRHCPLDNPSDPA